MKHIKVLTKEGMATVFGYDGGVCGLWDHHCELEDHCPGKNRDICGVHGDYAHCYAYAYDHCDEDHEACAFESYDVCVVDYYGCAFNSIDSCGTDNHPCDYPNSQDIT